jgi:hypothetical protein
VAPLAHCAAHGEDLPFKIRAGFANPHMRAQADTLTQTKHAIFARYDQRGYLFTGELFKHN